MKFWLILGVLIGTLSVPVETSAQAANAGVMAFPKKKPSQLFTPAPLYEVLSSEIPKEDCFPSHPVISPDVQAIAKENPANCWFLKKPIIYEDFKDRDVLESDMAICNCLRASKVTPVKRLMDDDEFADEKRKVGPVAQFEKSMDNLQNELKKDREGLAFQAKNISDKAEFFGPFGKNSASAEVVNRVIPEKKKTLMENAKQSIGGLKLSDGEKAQILNIISDFKVPDRVMNSGLFSETKFAPNQCVSGRDFLLMKQLPHEKVQSELKKLGKSTFSEADWSYNDLRSRFSDYMNLSIAEKKEQKEEMLSLRAKIRFLDRNPLFNTLLSLDSKLDFIEKIPDPKKKKEMQTRAANLRASIVNKKKDLLTILSNFSQNQDLDMYNDSLKKFFVDKDVTKLMDVAIEVNALKKLESITNPKHFEDKKDKIRSKNALYTNFSLTFPKKSPDSCSRLNHDNSGDCVDLFSAYCRQLDEILPKVDPDSESWMYDDFDIITQNDANPNINSNPDLLAFNEAFCKDFNAYRKEQCQKNKQYDCRSNDPELIRNQRNEYLQNRKPTGNAAYEFDLSLLAKIGKKKPSNSYPAPINNDSKGDGSSAFDGFAALREEWGAENFRPRSLSNSDGESLVPQNTEIASQDFSGGNQAFTNAQDLNAPMNPSSQTNFQTNYNSTLDHDEKVENMSTDQKRELLNDWKKEYEDLSEKKSTAGAKADSSEAASLKERISALEELLKDQKKLTDDQYKLLNQSIAAKENQKKDEEAEEKGIAPAKARGVSSSQVANDSSADNGRSPASISDGMGQRVSNSGPAQSFSPSERRMNSNSDSSAESIAREEAKLINLRNNADGSLTIEAVKNGSNSGNAITLPVTDEQYKILQTNPEALNLTQLEKKIPKDQIEKLEKNGEIIILLRNGANPPFEVKVEKKNNKLVYRLKDDQGRPQNPVRRVNTLQALGLQFKNP